MFLRSFFGACIASTALGLKLVYQTPTAIAELLSQTKAAEAAAVAEISAEICQRASTWNKLTLPEFYDIYAGNNLFTDEVFPRSDGAFAWSDGEEVYSSAAEA